MDNLEDVLLEIAKYGEVSLFNMTLSGVQSWSARVDMHINITGVKIEIRGSGHTAKSAAKECLTLMQSAIEKINSTHGHKGKPDKNKHPVAKFQENMWKNV